MLLLRAVLEEIYFFLLSSLSSSIQCDRDERDPEQGGGAIMWATWALMASVAVVIRASPEVATNQWLVQLKQGVGAGIAKMVAKRTGFSYVSPVSKR